MGKENMSPYGDLGNLYIYMFKIKKAFMNFTIKIINKYLILDCDSFFFLGRNGSDFPQPSCVVAETWTEFEEVLLQQTHPESRESQAKIVVCSW